MRRGRRRKEEEGSLPWNFSPSLSHLYLASQKKGREERKERKEGEPPYSHAERKEEEEGRLRGEESSF